MANDDNRTTDARAQILAELLQTEISVNCVIVALELMITYPAAVLLRNEIGELLGIAKAGAASVAALRDLVWAEFGVGGVSDA